MAASSKVLLLMLCTALLLFSCLILGSNASTTDDGVQIRITVGVRRLLLKAELADEDEEEQPIHPPKKTKPTAATTSTTSQSKILSKSSTTLNQSPQPKPKVKKLNSTATSSSKQSLTSSKNSTTLITTKSKKLSNTTSKATDYTKKSPDLISSNLPKNKTTKAKINNLSQPNSTSTAKIKKITAAEVTNSKSQENPNPKTSKPKPKQKQQPLPSWIDQDEEDDLVDEFRNLPSKFQKTLLPDLESISQTSKAYLTEANKEMTKNFKPLIGNKYASTTANIVSFTFIILPLILVSLLITRIKTYFSLQKLLIFINIYLSIYFTILSLSALITGIEPLRFLFITSQSTYVGIQILQTLCYVMYLLLLVMYLVLVFSTAAGLGSKMLGLAQTFVGFAVGLHYYVAVFHRVVMHQPPKTNWKVHGVYATCFLLISVFASAERRKKEYLEDGGEEGKKS